MIVLHATLLEGKICFWSEEITEETPPYKGGVFHPYAASAESTRKALEVLGLPQEGERGQAYLWLPTKDGVPLSSRSERVREQEVQLAQWKLPLYECGLAPLSKLAGCVRALSDQVTAGVDLQFLCSLMRFAVNLLRVGAFLPGLKTTDEGACPCWLPNYPDGQQATVAAFVAAFPSVMGYYSRKVNGVVPRIQAERCIEEMLASLLDALIRTAWTQKKRHGFHVDRTNPHALWLAALGWIHACDPATETSLQPIHPDVTAWLDPALEYSRTPWRLLLKLHEPEKPEGLWKLTYGLRSLRHPERFLPAEALTFEACGMQTLLLRSVALLARILPAAERSLQTGFTHGCSLSLEELIAFLESGVERLEDAAIALILPEWWRNGSGAQLSLTVRSSGSLLSLAGNTDTKWDADWNIALDGMPLSQEELKELQTLNRSLFELHGRWVWLTPKRLHLALLSLKRAQRLNRQGVIRSLVGGHYDGLSVQAEGKELNQGLKQLKEERGELPPPPDFTGTLRPYQQRGYGWMAEMSALGLGACLADDMGLGKTIQTLALFLHSYHKEARPSLLVCPVSVMENWVREAARFAPTLPIMVHHGARRLKGEAFVAEAQKKAIVLVSYSLLQRDSEQLGAISWQGIVLDEAQNIKNPDSAQARSARSLESSWRLALTGTPVENHLGDLWALMEFLNSGYLGAKASFFRRYVRVDAEQESGDIELLKNQVAPFILRRLKSDPQIAPDLPEKIESTLFCGLKKEQAALYAGVVEELKARLADSDGGIQRRGVVLASLTRLKQICNHPALFLGEPEAAVHRSSKLERLLELCESVHEAGEKMLIFTQYVEMGRIIQYALERAYGVPALFLHGGLSRDERQVLIERFKKSPPAATPFFILSLKAGGTGLNLTEATHVVLFDRWWNPATEQQAIDRIHRIGQTQVVQVHLFCCKGTLEDRIDALIREKKRVAGRVIESGEQWIADLDDGELQRLVALEESSIEG